MTTTNLQLEEFGAIGLPSGAALSRNMRKLDAVVQLCAIAFATAPPVDAQLGDRYIVEGLATGAFAGHERHVAYLADTGWQFAVPENGWTCMIGTPPRRWVFSFEDQAWSQESWYTSGLVRTIGATWLRDGEPIPLPAPDVPVVSPFTGTIVGLRIVSQGGPGDAVLDIRKSQDWPPAFEDTIVPGNYLALSGQVVVDDVLSGWITQVRAGDYFLFHLTSNDVFTSITVQLFVREDL